MDFKNKVIIITGASSRIGTATALLLANLSAKLVLTGRNETRLIEVAAKVEKAKGIKPLIIKSDLTNDDDIKQIVVDTIGCFGKIDILINNAGARVVASIKNGIIPLDLMLNTNLRSVYFLTHLASPHIMKTKGNIVNVSSILSTKPIADFAPYCISKAGLDMLTKCVAKDLAKYGVRVNSVNPGPVTSELHDRLGLGKEKSDKMMKDREKNNPLGKIGGSEDVAELIAFLASNKAQSITGSMYVIVNGYVLP